MSALCSALLAVFRLTSPAEQRRFRAEHLRTFLAEVAEKTGPYDCERIKANIHLLEDIWTSEKQDATGVHFGEDGLMFSDLKEAVAEVEMDDDGVPTVYVANRGPETCKFMEACIQRYGTMIGVVIRMEIS